MIWTNPQWDVFGSFDLYELNHTFSSQNSCFDLFLTHFDTRLPSMLHPRCLSFPFRLFSYVTGLKHYNWGSHSIWIQHPLWSKHTHLTSYLWNSEKPLFVRKNTYLSLFDLSPYSYPWKHQRGWSSHFLRGNLTYFGSKNGCFVRDFVKSLFWQEFHSNLDFRSRGVSWGCLRPVSEGCC